MGLDGDEVVLSLEVAVECRLETLLLLSAVVGCGQEDCYRLAVHLVEGVLLLLNLDCLRLLLLGMHFHLDLDDHLHFDCCCLLDHWVDHLLLVPLALCAVSSTAMDMRWHWVLPVALDIAAGGGGGGGGGGTPLPHRPPGR